MREYGFSLTLILPYKDKIYWNIQVCENPYSFIFYAAKGGDWNLSLHSNKMENKADFYLKHPQFVPSVKRFKMIGVTLMSFC